MVVSDFRYTRLFGWKYLFLSRKQKKNKKTSYKHKKKRGSGFLSSVRRKKISIAKREGRICAWCKHYFSLDDLSVDHIIPLAQGGTNDWDNLQLLCIPCHTQKDCPPKTEESGFENKPFAVALEKLEI